MKKCLLILFVPFFSIAALAQYNLGFENFKPGTDTLLMWNRKTGPSFYGPIFTIDENVKHSGKQSLSIERRTTDTATKFTPISITIPADFEGETLEIKGWMKTENVVGYAQLWLRIDNEKAKVISLTNYPRNTLKGTTDWTEYVTSVKIPEDAHTIYFGFLLAGTGKVWADDLNLIVNKKTLADAVKIPKKIYQASKDKEEFTKGSGISLSKLTALQIENLSLLAKVWGFLKYFHPHIAQGNINWDYELFRFLPSYLAVATTQERNTLLLQWINKFPAPGNCKTCTEAVLEKAIYKPDLGWIYDKDILGNALSTSLDNIKRNRHQGINYYMDLETGVKNPKIKHEDSYSQFTYPDAGYRLLTLFRYWNIIQYWFPYKHLIGEDWKNVLTAFIPKMIDAGNVTEYTLTTQQLIGRIHDTHANIWSANTVLDSVKGKLYAPVKITFVGEQAVVSRIMNADLAVASNLKTGDIINAINGKTVREIINEKLPNLPASNLPTQLRDLSSVLLRSNDSSATITVVRNGNKFETTLLRYLPKQIMDWYKPDFSYQNDSSFFFMQPGIGYINLGKIKVSQVENVFKELEDSKGLVIDNRQYPGEFTIYVLAEKLLPKRKMFTKIPVGSLEYPGMFTIKKPLYAGKTNTNYYKGKVVILVNENTQSSGEFHSMAFRMAPGAIVVGSTTAGADGNVSGFYLPGAIYTMFSGISILYPDEKETQRIGIVPDVQVKRTVEGIQQGKDELLEKAIQLILDNK